MASPSIKVQGRITDFAKAAPKPKKRYSTFFLTISTNQKYKPDDPHLKADAGFFENSLKSILDDIGSFIKLDGVWDADTIHAVDIDYSVELGHKPKGSALHGHILLRFQHTAGDLKLDFGKIKAKLLDDLGVKNIYMLNRVVRGSGTANLLEYLEKYA